MEGRKRKFLTELQKKSSLRAESGLYLADGLRLCMEVPADVLEEYYVSESFLKEHGSEPFLQTLAGFPHSVLTDSEMKAVSDTVHPQGIMALVRQKRTKGLKELLSDSRTPLLFLLEDVRDPGNLGTIIRAGEAAGVTGILMNKGTADLYSPKTVRSTMGSIFRMNFLKLEDLVTAAAELSSGRYTEGRKLHCYAADLKASRSYSSFDYTEPCAFMIGNEANGLSEAMRGAADEKVFIPMQGQVESLNAAMAAVILVFEAARQRNLQLT